MIQLTDLCLLLNSVQSYFHFLFFRFEFFRFSSLKKLCLERFLNIQTHSCEEEIFWGISKVSLPRSKINIPFFICEENWTAFFSLASRDKQYDKFNKDLLLFHSLLQCYVTLNSLLYCCLFEKNRIIVWFSGEWESEQVGYVTSVYLIDIVFNDLATIRVCM